MQEQVILVDRDDREVGTEEKLRAHVQAKLHRAFSVFIIGRDGAFMLQQRARTKYHSGGLWSNTCCGHPRPGETTEQAARRRLREEMGFDCDLEPVAALQYRLSLACGLVEHEYDHVFLERYAGEPAPNPEEVEAWRWARPDSVLADRAARPHVYTGWFGPALDSLLARGPHCPQSISPGNANA